MTACSLQSQFIGFRDISLQSVMTVTDGAVVGECRKAALTLGELLLGPRAVPGCSASGGRPSVCSSEAVGS